MENQFVSASVAKANDRDQGAARTHATVAGADDITRAVLDQLDIDEAANPL
ncbi:hypothetical protein [Burkholderia cenocepacia]|uniref:hypothetical protein n=1 Tax=Burkholderia cenocepacia TaxID=95486 RepID=UPI0023B8B9A5|nr:hypothetical protein [Burkholderia cenocepacia]